MLLFAPETLNSVSISIFCKQMLVKGLKVDFEVQFHIAKEITGFMIFSFVQGDKISSYSGLLSNKSI